MNRLKSQYMQSSLFSAEQEPYYMNEFTPFQGIAFLSDDYKKDQLKIQARPFSNEVTNVLQPSSRYAQQHDANRLRGSIAKSSKLQALISTQAGSSLAIGRSTSQKLSALSVRAGGLGLEQERARFDKEKEDDSFTAPPVKLVGLTPKKEVEKKQEGTVEEDDMFDILQPSRASRNKMKAVEKKEEQKEEKQENVAKAPGGKVRLSALAKTMKLKKALDEQAELQSKGSLMQNPERLKEKLSDFYASVNVKKSDDFLDNATKHIQDHGFGAFQEKLITKYGRGLEFNNGNVDGEEEDEFKRTDQFKEEEDFSNQSLASPFKSLGIVDVDPSILRERIAEFYASIGDRKDPSFLDSVMQRIEHGGVEKFNEGLREKYGVDLDSATEELEKVRKAMPAKAPPRGNIFSNMISGRFRSPVTAGGGGGTGAGAGAVRESIESVKEETKGPRLAIFSIMGRGDKDKKGDAKKPGKIAAVLGNLMNFRPGRRSVAFNGSTNQLESTTGPRANGSNRSHEEEYAEKAETPFSSSGTTGLRPKTLVTLQEQLDLVDEQIRGLNEKIEGSGPSVEIRRQLSELEEQKKELRYRIGVKNVEILI